MALGDPYVSVVTLKTHITVSTDVTDAYLTRVVGAISRSFERHCNRQFNNAGSASARHFRPATPHAVQVDDFHTTTGLVVKSDVGDDGTYETTWAATDFDLYPLDGIVDGQTGWPYRKIVAVESRTFPCNRRPSVQVTANWGWATVPTDIEQAALIQATHILGRKFSHNGLVGQGEFVFRVANRLDPDVRELLEPYRRHAVLVG